MDEGEKKEGGGMDGVDRKEVVVGVTRAKGARSWEKGDEDLGLGKLHPKPFFARHPVLEIVLPHEQLRTLVLSSHSVKVPRRS